MTSNQEFRQHSSAGDANVTTIDWEDYEQASTAIAEAVADVTDRTQTELEPLQHSVNADALDNLFLSSNDRPVEVVFDYAGVNVRVTDTVVEVWQ